MKREKNNKGFSLVELIIVIAIMVILVAVIVPQYLKYVHNSKISVDVQTASDWATAIDVGVADGSMVSGNNAYQAIGATSNPTSKLGGTWYVDWNAVDGVREIKLTGVSNGASPAKTEYQVYPNPDNTTNGINQAFTGVGLRK